MFTTTSGTGEPNNSDESVNDDYYQSYEKLFAPSMPPKETGAKFDDVLPNILIAQQGRDAVIDSKYKDNDKSRDGISEVDGKGESGRLTHIDANGNASMVDVGRKPDTHRIAMATGRVRLNDATYRLLVENRMAKGDVLTVAQVAGIMAAKQTSRLIPLCHNIPITKVDVRLELEPETSSVVIRCIAETFGKTGIEMEALTGVAVAALTVYDMCKAVSHDIVINDIQLVQKSGGRSGDFVKS